MRARSLTAWNGPPSSGFDLFMARAAGALISIGDMRWLSPASEVSNRKTWMTGGRSGANPRRRWPPIVASVRVIRRLPGMTGNRAKRKPKAASIHDMIRSHPMATAAVVVAAVLVAIGGIAGGCMPAITNRPTMRSSMRATSRSDPRWSAPSPRSRSPTTRLVETGGLLVQIDPRDYRAAVAEAEAQVAQANADDRQSGRPDRSPEGPHRSGQEAGGADPGRLTFAQQENARAQDLLAKRAGTRAGGAADLLQSAAGPSLACRAPGQRRRRAETNPRAAAAARHGIGQLEQSARRCSTPGGNNLERTVSPHPSPAARPRFPPPSAHYAQPGQVLMIFVPRTLWVTANFKETQLDLHAAGPTGRHRDRRLSGPHLQRPCRQPPIRQRHRVQPAAARKRHRQFRQGRAARAGQDRVRPAA